MHPGIIIAGIIFIPLYVFAAILLRWLSHKYDKYERLVLKSIKKPRQNDSPERIAEIAAQLIRDISRRN